MNTNVTRVEDCKSLIDETVQRHRPIDILVNYAGLQHVSPITEFPEEKWDLLIDVMLKGTFLCTKYALPLKRLLEPPEVADPTLHLASDSTHNITGGTILIDKGWTAR